MATYHILNGDALAETFKQSTIAGNIIVARECLIDGPVSSDDPDNFWKQRAEFLDPVNYNRISRKEFDRIETIRADDQVNLWFEDDLFCQTNMWFIIALLNKREIENIFRVYPIVQPSNRWAGFGKHTVSDLGECYKSKKHFTKSDLKLGEDLWNAYRKEHLDTLAALSRAKSECYSQLDDVCSAEIERKRDARPQKVLRRLIANGYKDFNGLFKQFSLAEGIYGFGDLQVKKMVKDYL